MEDKVRRVCELKNLDENEAIRLIKDTDKRRSINYKYFTGQTWGDRRNYTVVLNSTRIGMEKTAEIIASLY
jgi:cytidylate kinase